jgi:Mg2+ and Co2+ transporter CorA
MTWYDIIDPRSRQLDELAARYSLHALHVEDCRTGVQRTKVENESDYLFIALMLMPPERGNLPAAGNLNLLSAATSLLPFTASQWRCSSGCAALGKTCEPIRCSTG